MRFLPLLLLFALPASAFAAPRPELVLQIPHAGTIVGAVLSPSGQTIAATSDSDGAIKLWDARTGELRRTLEGTNWNSDFAFAPDGRTLVASGYENLRVWDVLSGQLRQQWEIGRGVLSPDAKRLAALKGDGKTSWIEPLGMWPMAPASAR